MWEFVIEVLIHTVPQTTGHAVVAVVTLGRVKVSEGWAEAIGIGFWLLVLLLIGLFVFMR
jgi:hypothetical protein